MRRATMLVLVVAGCTDTGALPGSLVQVDGVALDALAQDVPSAGPDADAAIECGAPSFEAFTLTAPMGPVPAWLRLHIQPANAGTNLLALELEPGGRQSVLPACIHGARVTTTPAQIVVTVENVLVVLDGAAIDGLVGELAEGVMRVERVRYGAMELDGYETTWTGASVAPITHPRTP